ncbi:zinc finger CCHC domain-containing protein 8-like isoform X2 [Argonauta hians]
MASSFGDSSLFEEFERDRSSESTIISYNRNEGGSEDRSKIIFRFQESDSSSSEDSKSSGEDTEVSEDSEHEENDDRDTNEEANKDEDIIIDETNNKVNVDEDKGAKRVKKRKKKGGDVMVGIMKHTNHQLQFERDKLKRFAKKIDSTRCVPDEESPSLQIIYQNNEFSRKYRAEIEDFVNHLLLRHHRERVCEKLPDLNLKASALTCIDLNDELDSEQRSHNMWCNHAIIGTSQFYSYFQIDTTGWPLVNLDPSLTDSWEIPKYDQVFFEALPINLEEGNVPKGNKPARKKPQCFNCGGAHMIRDCKEERDQARINMNRQSFMQNNQSNTPKSSRYHAGTEQRFADFKPGYISDNLREAMRLGPTSVPLYIYKMRFYGYPPGWLQEAKTKTASGMSLFDKHGKLVDVSGKSLEDGEIAEAAITGDDEIDPQLIIDYPGFTVPLPEGFIDEHCKYNLPPMQEYQLKSVLHNKQGDTKKRKQDRDKAGNSKRHRSHETSSDMDIDTDESFPYYEDLGTHRLSETNYFVPPLPSDTPPSKPPLPSDTPPSSGSDSKYSPKNEPSRQSSTTKRAPLCLPKPKSDATLSSDSLEDLEAQYQCLQRQLQEDSDSQPSSESQVKVSESNSIVLSSDESSNSQAPSDGVTSSSSPSMCQSLSKDYGTPVNQNKGSFPTLPDRTNFSVGIQDHIPFENLPQSTGTYNRMRQVFQKIKSRNKS